MNFRALSCIGFQWKLSIQALRAGLFKTESVSPRKTVTFPTKSPRKVYGFNFLLSHNFMALRVQFLTRSKRTWSEKDFKGKPRTKKECSTKKLKNKSNYFKTEQCLGVVWRARKSLPNFPKDIRRSSESGVQNFGTWSRLSVHRCG